MIWQSRPVFISSTFSDMQAERDHLRTHVFPELEERLRACRRHLEWVDLRLGVATASYKDAQLRELLVLKVCLGEVRRCRPFLIVLLGDRYGWVPPADRIVAAAMEEGLGADVIGRSVTDLEISLGVLNDPTHPPRSYFYFREALPYADMPPEVAAAFAEEYETDANAEDRRERLATLKHAIEARLPDRVRRYAVGWDRERHKVIGLEAWGRRVVEDLWSDFAATVEPSDSEVPYSWQQAERIALSDYIEDRGRDFVPRTPIVARLINLATSAAQDGAAWGLCLTGDPGTGKSAIFAEVSRQLRQRNVFCLAHAAGASGRSPSVEDMLRRWIEELSLALGIDPAIPENASPQTVEIAFHSLLGRMASQRRIVVLIDGLDQFESTMRARYLTWLPRVWPSNARLIATAIPGDASKALQKRTGIKELPLLPLDTMEARQIAEGICARYHRTLEPEVLDALLAKSGNKGATWSNTLWLVLASEELNLVDADDFARAKRSYTGTTAEQLRALMLDIVAGLPTDILGLYGATFDRAYHLFGAFLPRAFLGFIAISRGGWRESDFRALLPRLSGEPWDELRFASLRRLFRGQVRQCGALRQWDFSHAQMREAVRERLATQSVHEAEFHAEIAEHLLSLTPDDPLRQTHMMVHLLGSKDLGRAAAFYGSPSLTTAEVEGATRVLADEILSRSDCQDGVRQVLALLQACAALEASNGGSVSAVLVHRLLLDLDGMLVDRASLSARAALLNEIRETLARLIRRDRANVSLQFDLCIADERIGDVLMAHGDVSGALKAYETKNALVSILIEARPDNLVWQRHLSIARSKIGDALRAQGNLHEALMSYRSSLAVLYDLGRAQPTNIILQRDICIVLERLGNVLRAQGNLHEALQSYRTSLFITHRLARANPFSADRQHDLCISYNNISDVLVAQGNLQAALESFQAALAIAEDLVKADPTNLEWQRNLSITHEKVGDIRLSLGDLRAALDSHHASLVIRGALVKADPGNAAWRYDLGISNERVGDILMALYDLPGALNAYQSKMMIITALAESSPTNRYWQRDLYVGHIKMGDVLRAQDRPQAALESFQAALAIAEDLVKADSTNPGWHRDLSVAHEKVGEVLMSGGNAPRAIQHYQDALSIIYRLAQQEPENISRQADLAATYGTLGQLLLTLGRQREALPLLERGRAIIGPLAAQTGNTLWKQYEANFELLLASLEK